MSTAGAGVVQFARLALAAVGGEIADQRLHRLEVRRVDEAPAVRALARSLEVNIASVTPSGPGGSVTTADVERAARSMTQLGAGAPLRGMRRAMAQRMSQAHREVVPAGVCDDADVGDWTAGTDISVRLIRAIAAACKAEPALNAVYAAEAGARHLVTRIDVGIAVDTEDGLIVPVMRNVGERDMRDLRTGLDRLRAAAKSRVMPPEELKGATITLSNFGMFGGRYAHLVVVPPQVAIIGAGRTTDQVVAAEILDEIPRDELIDVHLDWQPERLEALKSLRAEGKPWAENWHWDWSAKADNLNFLAYRCFAAECKGRTQGLVMISTSGWRGRIHVQGLAGRDVD